MQKTPRASSESLYLQAFILCALGCLLIGMAIAFPFSYYRHLHWPYAATRMYYVERAESQVSNTTPSFSRSFPWYNLDAVEIREFYTNNSPVILHVHDGHTLNITYYNFFNDTAEPLNLSFSIVENLFFEVRWNNTPAIFSCWLFLRQFLPPPVVAIAPDFTPYIVPPFLGIFGFVLLISGGRTWVHAFRIRRKEYG